MINTFMISQSLAYEIMYGWNRQYHVYSCGYIKNRKRVVIFSSHKELGKVANKYQSLKRKYKSAWFKCHRSPEKIMREHVSMENPLTKMLKEHQRIKEYYEEANKETK